MNVIICGGGTVGHLTPGISIAEIITRSYKNSRILFVGREGGEENSVIEKRGFKLKTIKISGISRSLSLKNLKSLSHIISSGKRARKIVKEEKPDLVIGTGGYVCWPIIRAAQKEKIPTMIHESNILPGLATKLLSPKCDKVLLNFKQSEIYFKRKDNLMTVGNPLPKAFETVTREEARRKLGLSKSDFFILSFGGSTGAQRLNESIISLMESYSVKRKSVKHLHGCGKRYFEEIKEKYPLFAKGKDGCKIVPFIDEMATYMKAADTVISRCGAMTLSEICACKTVPILIPSPNVTANHQYKNAKVFTDSGAALMIEESELNDRTILDAVRYLESNPALREKMKKRLSTFRSDEVEKLILKAINEIIKKPSF